MTEFVTIICDGKLHNGQRVIDTWQQEAPGKWDSMWEEIVAAPYPLDARAEHERTVVNLANADSRRVAKLVDGNGQVRLRGGPTRTRRGYRFECPTCPANLPVSNRTLTAALEAASESGRDSVTLAELQHAGSSPARPVN